MGKIKQGILGGFRGKVGTVVGSYWNGIFYMKALPQSYKKGRSGYKQLLIDNYMAIYKVDDAEKIVKVITVQYQGKDI